LLKNPRKNQRTLLASAVIWTDYRESDVRRRYLCAEDIARLEISDHQKKSLQVGNSALKYPAFLDP
jgi:hypothetical protein